MEVGPGENRDRVQRVGCVGADCGLAPFSTASNKGKASLGRPAAWYAAPRLFITLESELVIGTELGLGRS